ncbi:MAG: hypothetical protein GY847_20210 [Proteobacteria bacterium]|nr:hypothetical protein [Pseudomonadota bacterium]
MDFLVSLVSWANIVTNAIGGLLLAPVSFIPGWLSITIISAVMGVVLLILFKYTSNQKAIGHVRDDISANLLAIKLFKDNVSVTIKSQARVFGASFKLLYYAIVPMLIMMVPVSLVLAQMGLWYQTRPFQLGDEPIVVKLKLNQNLDVLPDVTLDPLAAAETTVGPVRVESKQEIYWKLRPQKKGDHRLIFHIGNNKYEKHLLVGDGFMRVNPKRPQRDFFDVLLYPLEDPFPLESTVQSINIDYPIRDSWVCGTDWWIIYFFVVSMIFALIFKPFLKVRI